MVNSTIFLGGEGGGGGEGGFENLRGGTQARNLTTNVPESLDIKSSSDRYFPNIVFGCP